MFSLAQKTLPASAAELIAALETSLRRLLVAPDKIVSIREKVYPDLAEIAIDLTDAKVRVDAPRPSFTPENGEPALTVERLTLTAKPLLFGPAALNLTVNARDITLHQRQDRDANVLLLLHSAGDGEITISMRSHDLKEIIGAIAIAEAAKQGVRIEDVQLTLAATGPRSLRSELKLTARKLFLRATLRISGKVEIDDQLVAHIRDLNCTGEGAIATLACSVLAPHLQKLNGRDFDLMVLPLGDVQLRDVSIETTDGVNVNAKFGSARRQAA